MSKESGDVVALRPFVPASDFAKSMRFYRELGFAVSQLDTGLGLIEVGAFSFLLQEFEAEGFASNYMMQLMVNDLEGWWRRVEGIGLAEKFGVEAPRPPARQPWGLRVAYVFDPSGVLWHVAQRPGQTAR